MYRVRQHPIHYARPNPLHNGKPSSAFLLYHIFLLFSRGELILLRTLFLWFREKGLARTLCVIMLFQRTRRATCPCALFCYNFSEERRIFAGLFVVTQFKVATHLPMCEACPCRNLLPQIPHAVFSLRYRRGIFPDDIRLPRKYRAILKMKGRFIWILDF